MSENLLFRAIVVSTLSIVATLVLFGSGLQPDLTALKPLALERATVPPDATGVFGLAQFLSALALLVTILNVADFRYQYRSFVWIFNIQRIGIWAVILIGLTLIWVEFWFLNHLPLPHVFNAYANIKLFLAALFAGLVIAFVAACFVWPPRFKRTNALRFFRVTNYHLHQGNADRLQAIAEELRLAIGDLFVQASKLSVEKKPTISMLAAHDTILVLANKRFCHVIVDRVPGFALRCFELASLHPTVPFADFAHFIGFEFIVNTTSVFHEEDIFGSGYSRLEKPVSKTVFGNYKLVERCASQKWSPLDVRHQKIKGLDKQQIEGFYMAATAFSAAYLAETKGRLHSYAFARLIGSFESMTSSVSKLDGTNEGWHQSSAFVGLQHAMKLIAFVTERLDKLDIKQISLREGTGHSLDPYDGLAQLYYEAIWHAAFVTHPEFTCWDIQHNVVWRGERCSARHSKAMRAIRVKVRRKLYDKIRELDHFPNFVGARILGFCLNVLGLHLADRQLHSLHRPDFALQRVVLAWTKSNFRRLIDGQPNLGTACLQGFVSYDKESQRLVRGSGNKIKDTSDNMTFLDLD